MHEELADCAEIEWAERSGPRFPSEELRRGTIGSVYVGFALGEDLKVRDARVMAEVPASNFGEAALKALSGWRAEALPPGDPACHRNFVTRFTFAID